MMMKRLKENSYIIPVVVTGIGLVASAAVAHYRVGQTEIKAEENRVRQHEDHTTLIKIQTDVGWIRSAIEKSHTHE